MTNEAILPDPLRRSAEARLVATPSTLPQPLAETLLHELQVHQVELTMQNEALCQAQVAMEESRDRYVDLYEFAPLGYLILSANGLIAEINLTGARLLGEIRQRLLQRRFAHFVADEERERWQRLLSATLREAGATAVQEEVQEQQKPLPEPSCCELLLQRGDGSRFHARLDYRRCSPAGAGPQVRIALSDISACKSAEAELRIAAIAFESQEGMLVTDAQGVIVRVNRAFCRLTGYSAEAAVGQTPALLSSGRHDRAFYRRMWQLLLEKGFWQGEMWNRRQNGKIYAEWLTISAVSTPDGAITHYVGTFSEITQNKEAEAEIHRLAYYDTLTQLPNRRLLHDRISQALAGSQRSGSYGALLFLDLDNFKNLNDTRGHEVGDQLLIETARRILTLVREGDTVARLGGDEFVVLLEDLSAAVQEGSIQAGLVGEKIRQALARPYLLGGIEFHSSVSIGAAVFRGHESVDTVLKHADLALYKAKSAGRNALRFFDPAMQTALDERSAVEADLRLALERGQLHLFYQAQVVTERVSERGSARHIVGAEALLRWEHPARGMVSPADFIPLAEETGLILPIGHWVLATACAQLKAWSAAPATRALRLAVNVSARQFRQPEFVAQVMQVLQDSGADPQRLKIELTESLVIDNVADTIARMQALKAVGVSFSMDDFGTGFSSLSYLKRLPLDQLKVDRSFVQDLASDPNDAAIVHTIVTMGQTLGLDVIAEGVETEAQLEILRQYGCTAYQGYLFARPLPLAGFEALLGNRATQCEFAPAPPLPAAPVLDLQRGCPESQ